jgi:hypothetical protein
LNIARKDRRTPRPPGAPLADTTLADLEPTIIV